MASQRLHALAKEAGALRHRRQPPFPPLDVTAILASIDEHACSAARKYLGPKKSRSIDKRESINRLSRSVASQRDLRHGSDGHSQPRSQRTLDRALESAINNHEPLRVVAGLIKFGAVTDLQVSVPEAVYRQDSAFLRLLLAQRSRHGQQAAVDGALAAILTQVTTTSEVLNDEREAIVSILLMAGGVVTPEYFDRAVSRQETCLVELLLRSRRHMPSSVLSKSLVVATSAGNYKLTSILLAYEADPNATGALLEVSKAARFIFAAAIVANSKHPISRDILNTSLKAVLNTVRQPEDLRWLELFLLAGADGTTPEMVSRARCAVVSREKTVIDMLLHFKVAFISPGEDAFGAAIEQQDLRLMRTFLKYQQAGCGGLSRYIPLVIAKFPSEGRIEPTRMLLDAGARGPGVHDSLDAIVQSIVNSYSCNDASPLDMSLLEIMLLDGKADVNWKNGSALAKAFKHGAKFPFARLCAAGPTELTRSAVLATCYEHDGQPLGTIRTDLAKTLLRLGVNQAVLNMAFAGAIEHDSKNEEIIEALVKSGADVACQNGRIAQLAAQNCPLEVFQHIAEASKGRGELISSLLPRTLQDGQKAKMLLGAGLPQSALDAALEQELARSKIRRGALDVLIAAGAVSTHVDVIVSKLCTKGDAGALKRVITACKPSRATIDDGFRETISSRKKDRYRAASVLLKHGVSQDARNNGLLRLISEHKEILDGENALSLDSVLRSDDSVSMIKLILSYQAIPDLACLKAALEDRDLDLLDTLMQSVTSDAVVWSIFTHANNVIQDHPHRFAVFRIILAAAKEPEDPIDDALITLAKERSHCLELWNFLLEHGASVNCHGGEAILETIRQQNLAFLPILLQQKPSAKIIGCALMETIPLTPGLRLAVTQRLLTHSISLEYMDQFLAAVAVCQDKQVIEVLLDRKAGPSPAALGTALLKSIETRPNTSLEQIEMLIARCGALSQTIDHALNKAVLCEDFDVIQLVINHRPSQAAIEKSMMDTFGQTPDFRLAYLTLLLKLGLVDTILDQVITRAAEAQDRNLIRLSLTQKKTIGPEAAEALATAASRADIHILTLLLLHTEDRSSVCKALDAMTEAKTVSQLPHGYACAGMLLKKGVDREFLDRALVAIVDECKHGVVAESYIGTLLRFAADVNAFDGEPVRKAAQYGQWKLFDQLVAAGATPRTLSRAASALFASGTEQARLESMLISSSKGFGNDEQQLVMIDLPDHHEPLTYLALQKYPRSHIILQYLLDNGCDLHWQKKTILDPIVGEENVNPLLWSLSSESCRQSLTLPIIKMFIQNVDTCECARKSGISALMLAAKHNLVFVVEELLAQDELLSFEDHLGRTALVHASVCGSAEAVQLFCSKGSRKDDGSIHEAARTLRVDIVRQLLSADHHPDYPSDLHAGRSALLETLLHAKVTSSKERTRLVQIIRSLLAAKADVKLQYEGKTALFCALSNDRPQEVLAAFLTTEWHNLNEDWNLYIDSADRRYSATMYIEQGLWDGDVQEREALLALLRQKRCQDRYFAIRGEQPAEAVGLPPELQQEDRVKRSIRDQHRLQMKLAQQSHAKQLEWQQKRHTATMEQELERDTAQRRSSKSKQSRRPAPQEVAPVIQQDSSTARSSRIDLSMKPMPPLPTSGTVARGPVRSSGAAVEAPAKTIPGPQQEEQASRPPFRSDHEEKIRMERQLLREQEEAAMRQSQRRLEEIARADESARLRNKLILSQIEARTRAQHSLIRGRTSVPASLTDEGSSKGEIQFDSPGRGTLSFAVLCFAIDLDGIRDIQVVTCLHKAIVTLNDQTRQRLLQDLFSVA